MASITTSTGSDGKPRYTVNYRDPDGRQRRKTFPRKSPALKFETTVESSKLTGTYLDPKAGDVSFESYATTWLAERPEIEETTREAVAYRLKLHVFPRLGSKRLKQIKPTTIKAWLKSVEHLAPSYRLVMFANISSILASAMDDEEILKNPCKAATVKKPVVVSRKVVPWTVEQVLAVHDALPERYRIVVTLGAGLGMRQGEIFGLSPGDVDFLRGSVEVQRQVKLYASNRQAFGLPKGNKVRTVPLPSSVRDELAAHLAERPERDVILPWTTLDGKPTTVPLVCSTREQTALSRNYFNSHIWHRALVEAGIEPGRQNGMHALRHFYASTLLDAGESIRAVSEYLGHSDPGFTLRTYTHLMPSSSDRTRNAVDDVLGGYKPVTLGGPESAFMQVSGLD